MTDRVMDERAFRNPPPSFRGRPKAGAQPLRGAPE